MHQSTNVAGAVSRASASPVPVLKREPLSLVEAVRASAPEAFSAEWWAARGWLAEIVPRLSIDDLPRAEPLTLRGRVVA